MDLKILLILSISFSQYFAANILAVFPFPGFSHSQMFIPILKELAHRGHSVDVFNNFPLKDKIEGYNDISLKGSAPILLNNISVQSARQYRNTFWFVKEVTTKVGHQLCETSFKTSQLQTLKNSTKKYDVVLTQLFGTDCMLGWGWHFGAPNVVMTTSVNLAWAAEMFGLPDNPSYIPNYMSKSGVKMNIYERIVNIWNVIGSKFWYSFYSRNSNKVAKEFFGEDMPDLDILARNISLQLINTHFSIHGARPLVPNIIEVSGVHIKEPKSVNQYFDKILTTDKKGIIYFNTGSLIKPETLPIQITQAIFNAFAKLPYKIIWKSKKEDFAKGLIFPDNIHFEPWLPQLEILCDPRVKLFVSHGGMFGLQETVYCGVPILGIPFFADQFLNNKQAEVLGFAKMLDIENISTETVLKAATELLNDPKYLLNAKKISKEFKDRPATPLDTAIFWIEYVIRHKGAPQLQSAAKNLTLYQYYMIDVATILIGVPLIILVILTKLFKRVIGSYISKGQKLLKIKTK